MLVWENEAKNNNPQNEELSVYAPLMCWRITDTSDQIKRYTGGDTETPAPINTFA